MLPNIVLQRWREKDGVGCGHRRFGALRVHEVSLLLLRGLVDAERHVGAGVRALPQPPGGDGREPVLGPGQELQVHHVRLEVVSVLRGNTVERLGLEGRSLTQSEGEGRHPADTLGDLLPGVTWGREDRVSKAGDY